MQGVLIPSVIDMVDEIRSDTAKFILVVEKDATFQRLQDDGFAITMQCILVTVRPFALLCCVKETY